MKKKQAFAGRRSLAECRIFCIAAALLFGLAACDRTTFYNHLRLPGDANYSYGKVIHFGKADTGAALEISGWSYAEDNYTWSDGPMAVLAVRLPPSDRPITLGMTMAGFTHPPELPSQAVEVYLDDEKIGDWQVDQLAHFTAPIPPLVAKRGGTVMLRFQLPRAISPQTFGGGDPRALGICVSDFVLTQD